METNEKMVFVKCDLNASTSTFLDGIGHCGPGWVDHGNQAHKTKSFQREIWFISVESKGLKKWN
jgi:hypothetical protein